MRRELERYCKRQQTVDLIYQSRTGETTKRAVKIIAINGDRVKAYCYARRACRVFCIANILAVAPRGQRAAGL
ncbi:WYL domain-containing protein [Brevibacillus borstelensis]|uniref:WYL domain-containing protein n=1 Tax=Brevibacillus borstelensis TaxID=45462 RepID=UPI0030C23E24